MMISGGFVKYYLKTSSLMGCNVKNVFDQAIMSVLQQRKGDYKVEVEKSGDDGKNQKEAKDKKKCFIF